MSGSRFVLAPSVMRKNSAKSLPLLTLLAGASFFLEAM